MPSGNRAHEHLYTATFTSTARVIDPSEKDRFVAKASLAPLRGLLPEYVRPEENPDLLYLAADGAVAGLCNLNDDSISGSTALAIYRSCASKYISMDHSRDKVVGVILYPGLSRYGTSEPLTEEQAAALNEPFNISFAGVLWKVVAGQLATFIRRMGDSLDDDRLSFSWEITFSRYSIGIGSRNLWDARVVNPEDPEFGMLDKRLRARGGDGKTEDGQRLFRIISDDAILLGFSIVANPAASVKGILPITESARPAVVDTPVEPTAIAPAQVTAVEVISTPAAESTNAITTPANVTAVEPAVEVAPAAIQGAASAIETAPLAETFITPAETRVTPNTATTMDIKSIAQLKDQWSEIRKLESSASVEAFVDAFQKANDQHLADLNAQKDLATTLTESKAAAEKRATELETSLAEVRKQLEDLKNAALAAEQNAKFQERMAALDEAFNLDNEDRELLAPEVRLCADDAAFAAFKKKQDKLMDGKKKGKMKKDCDDDMDADGKKKAKASITADTVVAAVASITPIAGQTTIPPGQVQVDTNLSDEMEAAFGSAIKIDGKTVAARKAEKAATAPKE